MIPKPALKLGTPCPIFKYPFCPGAILGPNSVIISIKTQLNPQNSGYWHIFTLPRGVGNVNDFGSFISHHRSIPAWQWGPVLIRPNSSISTIHMKSQLTITWTTTIMTIPINTTYKYTIDSGLPKHHNHPSPMYINGGPSMCTNITDVHQRGPLNEMAHTEHPEGTGDQGRRRAQNTIVAASSFQLININCAFGNDLATMVLNLCCGPGNHCTKTKWGIIPE